MRPRGGLLTRRTPRTATPGASTLAALYALTLCGCAGLHDWSAVPEVDGSALDASRRDAGCRDVCGSVCTDVATDVAHCGSCDIDCATLPNVVPGAGGVRCWAGRCLIPPNECVPGFADCLGPSDGCETDLTLPTSCGRCGNRCGTAQPLCDASTGTCTDHCAGGLTLCGATCVDTSSDARNCSACGLDCAAIPGSSPTCVGSVCSYDCLPGYHDCGTVCGLDASPLTCGASCSACPVRVHADATCTTGACGTACVPGFHDCGGVCVSNSDTLNCGTSCTACPAPPGATAICDGAICGVACDASSHVCGDACLPNADTNSCGASCTPCPVPPNTRATCDGTTCGTSCRDTHADCDGAGDGSDTNGCEADLSTPAHCGSCGRTCTAPQPLCSTNAGGVTCVSSCALGQSACGTSCIDLQASVQNCGSCGLACPVPANGEASCILGSCGVACDAGFHACGSACVANTSADGCGTSCSACPSPVSATATCDGIACGWQCDPGFHECGGACADDRELATCGASCTPCPSPTNGVATCNGTSCGVVCDVGFHGCGAACVANVSPATCGAACSPCAAPTHGVATCDGILCDFTCASTYHRCGDVCEPDTAPATCGAACSPCAPPPNADATCDGTACGFTCRAGFHRCGDLCVSDTLLSSCGASCTPCAAPAGAVATCDGSTCGFSCASGFANCDGVATNGCEADLAAPTTCGLCTRTCSGATPVCASGTCSSGCSAPLPVRCGASCTDTTSDPANCGGCGASCAVPTNGSATCNATACSFTCNPGYHACGSTCASDDSPATCGASCAPCAAPPGATATCTAGACGFVCSAGFNLCAGACVPEDSVTTCGTSCALCTAPASGVPACTAGACTFSCVSGTHRCGDGCVSDASTGSCGASCTPCVPPANAVSTCDGTTCDFTCNIGYLRVGAACVAIAPPRPLAPLSMSSVTSLSPVLRWALPAGTDGARVEVCADRACATVTRSIDVTGSTATVTPALTPGLWFWRLTGRIGANLGVVTSPVWEVTLAHRSAPRATAWGAGVDVNGDGYADALVGAPSSAAAYTHRGGSGGLSSTASRTLTGAATFGTSVSAAGDVDGDGFGDVAVGAPGARTVLVFYGSPTGLGARTPTTLTEAVATFGWSVAAAGDIDADGYGELLVGAPSAGRAYVYRGTATGIDPTAAWMIASGGGDFGFSVASAGDVNADGFADVIVGDPAQGEARIYHGAAIGLGATPTSARTLTGSSDFGWAVAGAGDVSGDGYTDVVVGAPGAKRAFVFLGSSTGTSTTAITLRDGSRDLGATVASAGDVDGDGYDDVLVGSELERRAWIFSGRSGGVGATATTIFAPTGTTTLFGESVTSPGDVDRDGVSDVLVGAPGTSCVYLYRGVLGASPSTTPSLLLAGPVGSAYGQAVALLLLDPRERSGTFAPLPRARRA